MDEIDVAICRAFMQNSRLSFSKLGEELDMSAQAIHRRVQALMASGIIQGTVTRLTPKAMGSSWLLIKGWSKLPIMDEMAAKLARSEHLALIQVASGNMMYVHGMVGNSIEMSNFVSFVIQEAQMHDVEVGIVPTPPNIEKKPLSPLDLRIVNCLRKDARRSISEIASEVDVTPKTVKRRLDYLVLEGLVNFSILWRPDLLGDTMTYIHLLLRSDVDRERAMVLLVRKYSRGIIRSYAFSNAPDRILLLYWTNNVREMAETCRELEREGLFVSVVPHILRGIYYFEEKQAARLQTMLARSIKTKRSMA
ncbi:MAG: AsnC family transcriptional regulator [Methanomassiliicoccales archaeon]